MTDLHLQKLVTELRGGNVIGLCGAGLSVPLGYPTWTRLMLGLLETYEATNRIEMPSRQMRVAIASGQTDLPTFAGWIRGQMASQDFESWLLDTFTARAPREFTREHQLLAGLPVRIWMTTNYDTCLEDALAAQWGRNVVPCADIPFAELDPRQTLAKVVHLHGWIGDIEKMVLTSDDYQRAYLRETRLSHSLASLAPYSLFSAGYGLADRDLKQLLETTRARLGGSSRPHFALLPRSEEESAFELEMRKLKLGSEGIIPIFYIVRGHDHSERESVLRSIVSQIAGAPQEPSREVELRWTAGSPPAELRDHIRLLLAPPVAAHLTTLSPERGSARFGGSEADLDAIAQQARGDPFWIDQTSQLSSVSIVLESPPTESARTDFDELARRDALDELHASDTSFRHVVTPLIPPSPPFGLADVFHPTIDWRPDSPIVHVFIYEEPGGASDALANIRAVTAIGTGIRPIREELETAAYTVALALPVDANAVVTRGLIHLSVTDEPPAEAPNPSIMSKIVGSIFGRKSRYAPPTVAADTPAALRDFCSLAERLAQATGTIVVHRLPHSRLMSTHWELMSNIRKAEAESSPLLLGCRGDAGAIKCFPYPRYPRPLIEPRIRLQWPEELFRAPALQRLLDAYYRTTVSRMTADLERRIDFWTNQLEGHRRGVEWYRGLPVAEQKKLPDVVMSQIVIAELAISVPTTEERVSAEVYYTVMVPNGHIPRSQRELARLEEELAPLRALAAMPYSAVWKRCLARIFDCALRGVPLSDDAEVELLYESWRDRTAGLLYSACRNALADLGIDPDDVLKRTTFFNVDFDERFHALAIYPNAIIDTRRASVLLDRTRGTIVVLDPLDRARSIAAVEDGKAALREDGAPSPAELYEHASLIDELCDVPLGEETGTRVLDAARNEVMELANDASAGPRALWQLAQQCHWTAEQIVQPDRVGPAAPAGKLLVAGLLLCIRADVDPFRALGIVLAGGDSQLPSAAVQLFRQAIVRNRALVERFAREQRLTPEEPELDDTQRLAWRIEQCLEAATIAEEFRGAADSLHTAQETLPAVFLKTEQAIESAYVARFARIPANLLRIQKIVTGEPLTGQETTG